VAFGVAVGVAGEGAEFLALPAQGVGGFGVLPRVVAVVVVEGDQAGVCEVVGVVWAGGQSLCLPLQVLQPLCVAPFHNRTLCCVGRWRFPLWGDSARGSRFLHSNSNREGRAADPAYIVGCSLDGKQFRHAHAKVGRERGG